MVLAEDTILEKRYRIDRVLTRSSRGAVYRAFDTNLSMPVAIKENTFQTPERIARFAQEALILTRLQHPALPRFIRYFSAESQHAPAHRQYLVMDFVEGENLWELVKKEPQPLAEDKALDYTFQVCRALSYLHAQSPPVIHRDLKPQNIKITPPGRAVLVDFGLARQVVGADSPAGPGALGIAPGFSSPPEQYEGRETTPTADIYALAATLYAVLTGQQPPESVRLKAGKARLQPPDTINPKISARVSQAILHAMQLKPVDRPQSVEDWQQELAVGPAPSASPEPAQVVPAAPPAAPARESKMSPGASPARGAVDSKFWLIDATGLGYSVGPEPLVIGCRADADIVVKDSSVSPVHARVRAEGPRCLVSDSGSATGTFLNERRLGSEWSPLTSGDMLRTGAVRFYLTTTQPAKLAPPKPEPVSPAESPGPVTAPPSEPPTGRGRSRFLLGLGLVFLIALLGVAGYWLVTNSAMFSAVAGASPTPTGPRMTDQAAVDATDTGQAPPATPTLAALVATVTPGSQTVEQDTIRVTATAKRSPTVTPTRQTPTPGPTPSPTPTPTRSVAVVPGPTVIPLESKVSVTRLGPQEVIDVDINPKNPREVYALVKGDGIYKSNNGGEGPWLRMNLDAPSMVAFVIDPSDPARFYAPTWNAVLKSTDGGNTWDPKTNGLLANRTVDVLAVDPTDSNILYAGVGENLVVSTDGGENWTSGNYGTGLGVARFYQLVVDPFEPATIYVAGLAASIYKSGNSGHTFLPMPYNTGQGAFGLAAHPTQQGVYLVGVNSAQAGISKTENGWDFRPASTGLIYGGVDSAYSAITYAPGDPRVIYAGSGYEDNRNAKGVFKSTDGGENWTRISNGLSINPDTGAPYYVKSIAVHPTDSDVVFAATGGGLFMSIDGGVNWSLQ